MKTTKSNASSSKWALIILSIFVTASVISISSENKFIFQPYVGNLFPSLAAFVVCLVGFVAFYFLKIDYQFEIYEPAKFRKGVWHSALLSIPFMIAVTFADLFLRFPKDINVALPLGALFYPAMGYIAQVALHVIPLAILLVFSRSVLKSCSLEHRIWGCIVLVSTIEAIFQVSNSIMDEPLSTLGIFMGIHLFLFSLAELYIFRRYDYLSMYIFRLIYYGYWHILWGEIRLKWLF